MAAKGIKIIVSIGNENARFVRAFCFFTVISKNHCAQFGSAMRATDGFLRNHRAAVGTFLCPGGGGYFLMAFHPVNLLDQKEKSERDDHEIDNRVDKYSIIQSRRAGCFCFRKSGKTLPGKIDEKAAEIDLAQKQPERRHENVVDQRSNDASERSAHDERDRNINHIPPRYELFEFFEHVSPPR